MISNFVLKRYLYSVAVWAILSHAKPSFLARLKQYENVTSDTSKYVQGTVIIAKVIHLLLGELVNRLVPLFYIMSVCSL